MTVKASTLINDRESLLITSTEYSSKDFKSWQRVSLIFWSFYFIKCYTSFVIFIINPDQDI